jgi:hypothetical protein
MRFVHLGINDLGAQNPSAMTQQTRQTTKCKCSNIAIREISYLLDRNQKQPNCSSRTDWTFFGIDFAMSLRESIGQVIRARSEVSESKQMPRSG